MAPLAGDPVRAAVDLALHDDPAAAAGAQDDAEHDAEAGSGAVGGFAQGEAVGVVLDAHLAVEGLADVVVEAVAVQRDGIGVLDQAGGWADHARDADPDRARYSPVWLQHCAHQSGDGVHGVVVGMRGGDALPQHLGAVGAKDRDLDFGAAQVDADSMVVMGSP